MSQEECLRIIKKESRDVGWITAEYISKKIGINRSSIGANLLKLEKQGIIERQKKFMKSWTNIWRLKIEK